MKVLVNYIFVLFLFVGPLGLMAQTTVKGTVVDGRTGDALIGANVILKTDRNVGVVTDFDGAFELKVPSLPTTLEISYIGYSPVDYEVTSANQKIQVKLDENAVTIDIGVEIKGQKISDKQKAAPLTVESLDAIAIKQTASTDFYNGLGSLKGVDLTTASLGFTVINTRGFNSTSPVRSLQTIDGVDNQSPGLNFSLGNFLGASELDIQKVDLVVGASSAFYGPNAFNGVIAMETKNPFFNRGLAASVKVGERNLFETAFRFADAFKNKNGHSAVAYKLNFSYLTAYDWIADNYDAVTDAPDNRVFLGSNNPGRANSVNIYGDESSRTSQSLTDRSAGLNTWHRTGYKEIELVDYNTKNIKAGAAVHIRTNPSMDFESPELIISSNFGYGTTVYQGDNRFRLDGIQFYQHKLELRKKDKYFIRAYATHEDAGNSYDPYFTAQKLLEASKTDAQWLSTYQSWWSRNAGPNGGGIYKKMQDLGYPANGTDEVLFQWQRDNQEALTEFHNQAAAYANKAHQAENNTKDFFEPGTARFDSLFNQIIAGKNNEIENGTRFFDRSALYHLHGERKWQTDYFKEITVGANGRLYKPNTAGTIFKDQDERITTYEYGVYAGASKAWGDVTGSIAARVDKNKNFDFLFSPAASVVWKTADNNYLRLSFSSAIRNPTLSDQFLNLKVGPATLLGNLDGFSNLITYKSFIDNTKDVTSQYNIIDVNPIRPEKVKTLELGYRTTLFDKLYVDASVFVNRYNDFIGYQIGLTIPQDTIPNIDPEKPPLLIYRLADAKVYRIAANSNEIIYSQGGAIGLSYYLGKYYSLNGNYSYNELVTKSSDEIVPAFNTPKHKYNVGFSGRDLPMGHGVNTLGFNVNYKWIQGFIFEGSPQFTGLIPTYDLVDAQVNYNMPKQNLTVKIGASNALNNKQFQTYGGPRIGRMAYLTVTYDFKSKIN